MPRPPDRTSRAVHYARGLMGLTASPESVTQAGSGSEFVRDSATTLLTGMFGLGVGVVQAAVVARVLKLEGAGPARWEET